MHSVSLKFLVGILSFSDYYPFGMEMPGRNASTGDYRYGFAGQEKDDEVSGSRNSYTAQFWQYDSRLGRRWNVDPVVKEHESSYATFANNPIWFSHPLGSDTIINPNGEKWNVGTGYVTGDHKKILYGDGLQTKVWDPEAMSPDGPSGNYIDYEAGACEERIENAFSLLLKQRLPALETFRLLPFRFQN
jgi:RHS repeat-associated protein